jgi:hypothetical protein
MNKKVAFLLAMLAILSTGIGMLWSGPISDPIFEYCAGKCSIVVGSTSDWQACMEGCYHSM